MCRVPGASRRDTDGNGIRLLSVAKTTAAKVVAEHLKGWIPKESTWDHLIQYDNVSK